MPPSKAQQGPPYTKDEAVLCFHGEMLYEAKVLDTRQGDDQAWQYKIHYKGWKATWDDWVPQDRVRKFTEENKELAASLQKQMKIVKEKSSGPSKSKKAAKSGGSDLSSIRGSEERSAATASSSRGPRRGRDQDLETEDAFKSSPSVKFDLSDAMKALLVGDWENVSKNKLLVPLPSPHTVKDMIDEYIATQKEKRKLSATEEALMVECMIGLNVYFDSTLSRILLYSFERVQYEEIQRAWKDPKSELFGKTPCTTYGPEHLARLIVELPKLIPQTTMDSQSVKRITEEMSILSYWLADNSVRLYCSEYETVSQSYIERSQS